MFSDWICQPAVKLSSPTKCAHMVPVFPYVEFNNIFLNLYVIPNFFIFLLSHTKLSCFTFTRLIHFINYVYTIWNKIHTHTHTQNNYYFWMAPIYFWKDDILRFACKPQINYVYEWSRCLARVVYNFALHV